MKKKKLLYLYYINYRFSRVTINQFLKTMDGLSRYYSVHYLSPWLSKTSLQLIKSNFSIKQNWTLTRLPIFPFRDETGIFIFQLVYSIFGYLYYLFNQVDYIYTRDFSIVYFLSLLPNWLRPKTKIIFEIHKIYHKTSDKVSYKQENRANQIVDSFVATSNNCKDDLIALFNIGENRIIVAPNGVDLDHFQRNVVDFKILDKFALNDQDKVIAYAGSFKWWKGVDDLIQAMHFVKDGKAKLLLIGGSGENLEKMKSIVESEDLEHQVKFTGHLSQKDMIELLYCVQVAVLPNNKSIEGEHYTSPVKLFEYMACGLPIIASNLEAINELIKEPDNCLFFEPENEKDLAQKIDQLLENPQLRKTMGNNNRKDVEKFTWDQKAIKIHRFLNNQ